MRIHAAAVYGDEPEDIDASHIGPDGASALRPTDQRGDAAVGAVGRVVELVRRDELPATEARAPRPAPRHRQRGRLEHSVDASAYAAAIEPAASAGEQPELIVAFHCDLFERGLDVIEVVRRTSSHPELRPAWQEGQRRRRVACEGWVRRWADAGGAASGAGSRLGHGPAVAPLWGRRLQRASHRLRVEPPRCAAVAHRKPRRPTSGVGSGSSAPIDDMKSLTLLTREPVGVDSFS